MFRLRLLPCFLLGFVVILPCSYVEGSITITSIIKQNYLQIPESMEKGAKIFNFTVSVTEDSATDISELTVESETDFVTIQTQVSGQDLNVDVFLNSDLDVDRENSPTNTILLTFVASGPSPLENEVLNIRLIVNDVNDETPKFINLPYSVTVKENVTVGSVIITVEAEDPDNNDKQQYTSSADTESPFKLETDGSLVLATALDFEKRNFYQYFVIVTDDANHTATADVFIRVEDVQDTPPEFIRDYYSFTVPENSPQGFSLSPALQAIDGDRGVPNDIALSIINGTCPDLLNIDATSGELTVKNSPDRDEGIVHSEDGLCTFFIRASEIGPGVVSESPSTSLASISVTVPDVNDNGPEFSQSIYDANIDEGAQRGVTIIVPGKAIAVKDIDQINNAKFSIRITKPLNIFEVTPSIAQGSADILIKVLNSTVIDFEENKSITIELEAKDEGNGLSSTSQVHLTINNVNDESPVFDQESYSVQIPERSSIDTQVIVVHATDGDADDPNHNFNEVTYSFAGTSDFFKINSVTGEVSVARGDLDREKQNLYYLNVVATDGGKIQVSTSLTITISDKNDQEPVIKSLQYQTFLEEESTHLNIPVQVQASDADEPNTENSEIMYSIVSTSPDDLSDYFRINPDSGELSVRKPLLFESIPFSESQKGMITITVMASDKGDPPLNSTVDVVVTLEDKNNKIPHCESQNVTISENLARFTVAIINATDEDGTAPNNEMMFTLDQASSDRFTIDSNSGEIKTWIGLDYEAAKNHSIKVTVTDLGSPPNSDSCEVFVQVSDVNDVPPAFENKDMKAEIKETEKLSFQCIAHDIDEDNDLKYEIIWAESTMQTLTGEVKAVDQPIRDLVTFDEDSCAFTVEPIDREMISMLQLQVQVKDKNAQENHPQIDTGKLSILVMDVNDNKPIFSEGSLYTATIKENLPIGSFVGLDNANSLKVTDADADNLNSKFDLKLLTHNTTFAIEPSGGTSSQVFSITVINSTDIDFEIIEKFTLELEVTEVGTNESFNNLAQVKINIVNENDNSPSFDQLFYEARIPEDSPVDFSVKTLQATDKDDPSNMPSVTYSFDRDNTFFKINKTTGEITVASEKLDREAQPEFYITVIAQDEGGRKDSCAFTVYLSDKNDNDPIFLRSQYETSVEEKSTELSNTVQVEAKDADEGANAEIVYKLTSISPENLQDFFRIDPSNGSLTMLKPLLYDDNLFAESTENTIILTVSAFDKGKIPRNSSVPVFVRLEDINNNSPRCDSDGYDIKVKENLENFQILKINATDEDHTAPNNRFLYSIDRASEDLFAIDSTTGAIVTRGGLDFEKSAFHPITVSVTDLGSPPKASTCQVNVTVQDVNDVAPTFDTNPMETEVKENTELSYPCPASDQDLDSELVYTIEWMLSTMRTESGVVVPVDSSIQNLVTINRTNCMVHVDALDRETVSGLDLVLQVEDIKAAGNKGQTEIGNLIISVLDENDEEPIFTNGANYIASIRENMPAETLIKFDGVAGIRVQDKDADEANSKFEVALLTYNTIFKIEPSEGTFSQLFNIAVLDSSKLDYEQNSGFTLQLQVRQIDSEKTFSSNATVELNIDNENDNFPSFEIPSYEVSILENSPEDTDIILIQAQDEDKGIYGELKYSFKEENEMFTINESTGQVKFSSGLLDFESGKTTYSLAVLATDGGNFTTSSQLVISVEDINDNSPEFLSSIKTEIHIDENQLYFYPSLIMQAKDKDSPGSNNSKIIYSLQPQEDVIMNHLQINEETGEITIKKAFDFESFDEDIKVDVDISFAVVATDMGDNPLWANLSLSLIVADANDESPEFTNTSYSISIPEDTKNASRLLTVQADDKDASDEFNTVTYSLDSASMTKFYIDSASGEMILLGALDRETDDGYMVVVSAADNGAPARMNTATVTVTVTDVNDTPPKFTWETKVINIEEGWANPLTTNHAEDEDLIHTLEYSIVWKDSSGVTGAGNYMEGLELKDYIKIDATTGEVSPLKPLDREEVQQYQLSLAVEDKLASSAGAQIDTALLRIVVEDINDSIPKFVGPEHIEATVKELAQVGSALTFVNFSVLVFDDADGEGNNTYSIAIERGDFSISPSEGRGRTACSIYVENRDVLDYEQNENLTLVVVATETENAEHTSSVTITLFIENENDNFPIFDSDYHTASIPEDAQSGASITTMKAVDGDKGKFGEVFYFIDGEQTRFSINNLTGEVTLNTADLDFEKTRSYLITVGAKDGGDAVTMTRLEIFVRDVNDKSPEFEGLPYMLEINEGSITPLRDLQVQATDSDQAGTDNSKITYRITRVFPTSITADNFLLNETTGELSVTSPMDFESLLSTEGEIIVEVVASDSGLTPLQTYANLTVKVLDRNDETPKFSDDIYTASVKENSRGVFVTSVSAVDDDGTEPNNEVYYVIGSGGQDKFQMNSSSGDLVVGAGAVLDRETLDLYTLTVLAIDKGSPPNTGTATVKVIIEDVNDARPTLTRIENSPLRVKENADKGQMVVDLAADDKDSHPSLEFSVIWEDSEAFDEKGQSVNLSLVQDWFIMDIATGRLSVDSVLDRETAEQIIIKAQVNDTAAEGDSVPQIDTVTLEILIEDINDNPPAIMSCDTGRQLFVSEATSTGTEITTFLATDRDKDQYVQFSLDNELSFAISESGKLSLAQTLDRESQPSVNFTVTATDSGKPTKNSTCDVQVIVEDANDNDPEFTSTKTDFSVSENATEGTFVGQISADDKDEGGNGKVSFDFMDSANSAFAIDDFGNITVNGELDREAKDLYSLTVIASDNPENPVLEKKRASTRLIRIHIEDENDETPVFDTGVRNSFSGILSEKQVKDYIVPISPKQIFASDQDIGKNAEIVYSFMNTKNSYFKINPSTGQVLVNNENLNGLAGTYKYTVVATDQGKQPLSATVNLTITVLDENINTPRFIKSGPIAAIPECTNIGSSIYTFVATDDDKDKTTNGKVTYALDQGTSTEDYKSFSIDMYTGVLKTREYFDRESNSTLQIQVVATDHGEPPLTKLSGLLTILISDVNDNPPDFKHLESQNIRFNVSEGPEAVGSVVGKVKAQDQDSNTTLTYKLLESTWSENFKVESDGEQGGIIKLEKPLDRETVESINLQVVAVDISSLSVDTVCNNTFDQSSTESDPLPVEVSITDVDDNPPVFSVDTLNKGFLSSTSFGTEITSLTTLVNDKDSEKHSVHKFYQEGELEPDREISKGWSKELKANPIIVDVNGSVVTNFKFPDDVHGQFRLRVKANDSAGEDMLEINIYIVGSSQVVYLTFYLTENDLRLQQIQITEALSGRLPYKIVPDNILPFNNKDGSVDGSKQMDTSSRVSEFLQRYKILNTQTAADAANSSDEGDDGRTQYILMAMIALMAIAFVITLFVLLNNIQRFKRKLKAATLEVHAMTVVEADQYPGLDNKIKSSNPVFMRDDLSLDDLDDISQHSGASGNSVDSLDQNNVVEETEIGPDMRQPKRVEAEEQEMTLDLYDQRQHAANRNVPRGSHRPSDADLPPALQFLNATLDGEEDGQEDVNPNSHPIYDEIGPSREMPRPKSDYENVFADRDVSNKNNKGGRGRPTESVPSGHNNYSFAYHVESTEI